MWPDTYDRYFFNSFVYSLRIYESSCAKIFDYNEALYCRERLIHDDSVAQKFAVVRFVFTNSYKHRDDLSREQFAHSPLSFWPRANSPHRAQFIGMQRGKKKKKKWNETKCKTKPRPSAWNNNKIFSLGSLRVWVYTCLQNQTIFIRRRKALFSNYNNASLRIIVW